MSHTFGVVYYGSLLVPYAIVWMVWRFQAVHMRSTCSCCFSGPKMYGAMHSVRLHARGSFGQCGQLWAVPSFRSTYLHSNSVNTTLYVAYRTSATLCGLFEALQSSVGSAKRLSSRLAEPVWQPLKGSACACESFSVELCAAGAIYTGCLKRNSACETSMSAAHGDSPSLAEYVHTE